MMRRARSTMQVSSLKNHGSPKPSMEPILATESLVHGDVDFIGAQQRAEAASGKLTGLQLLGRRWTPGDFSTQADARREAQRKLVQIPGRVYIGLGKWK